MDANIVLNTRVKQKDSSRAVVIAVTASSVFDLEEEEGPGANENEPFKTGAAFAFIKAVQRVNEKLLERDAKETLLFDVMLVSKSGSSNSRSRTRGSAVHYGLEIGRFCFCGPEEDFTEPLRSNHVKLFLSTARDDVSKAWERGVPAALLYPQSVLDSTGPLRVLFMGDILGLTDETAPVLEELGFSKTQLQHITAVKGAMREFARCVGEMRRRFRLERSPLRTCLVVAWSPSEACARALKTLRGWGLEVDEAFNLAGAPRGPILAQVRPHVLYDHGLPNPHGVPAELRR
ncbi:cytosolic 5'-nucleotidase 1A [Anguilla rostrata]|uniref:cytosolic 5'-nucleotidase 1A n=1 Tax=Anguilla rostrata TaxID=7938 RepID=UPI0030D4FBA3